MLWVINQRFQYLTIPRVFSLYVPRLLPLTPFSDIIKLPAHITVAVQLQQRVETHQKRRSWPLSNSKCFDQFVVRLQNYYWTNCKMLMRRSGIIRNYSISIGVGWLSFPSCAGVQWVVPWARWPLKVPTFGSQPKAFYDPSRSGASWRPAVCFASGMPWADRYGPLDPR